MKLNSGVRKQGQNLYGNTETEWVKGLDQGNNSELNEILDLNQTLVDIPFGPLLCRWNYPKRLTVLLQ